MREIRYLAISLLSLLMVGSVKASSDQVAKPLSSQEQSQHTISARAGGVNLAEGQLSLKRDQAEWTSIVANDNVNVGDLVRTGKQSRAEILLYPGAFLRLSEDTQLSFVDISPDHLKIRIDSGAAIVEAPALDKFTGILATIITPHGEVSIIRAGIYRFDIGSDGKTTAEVFKGKLAAGPTEVKQGQEAAMEAGRAYISDFDTKTLDSFDEWSKDRSKALASANARLKIGALQASRFGLPPLDPCGAFWYFNPPFGYIYAPFGSASCSPWFSPYGWPYRTWAYIADPPEPAGGHHHKHHKHHGTEDQATTVAGGKPKSKQIATPVSSGAKAAGAKVPGMGTIAIANKPSPVQRPARSSSVSGSSGAPRNEGLPSSLNSGSSRSGAPLSAGSESSGGGHPRANGH